MLGALLRGSAHRFVGRSVEGERPPVCWALCYTLQECMKHSSHKSIPRLFTDLADLWPLLSPPSYYAPEAASVSRVLDKHLTVSAGKPHVLEMGAGGGHTIFHLKDRYDIVALDLSTGMLDCCRRLNPEVEVAHGDMCSARLERVFDAVLIHDSVDYLVDEREVRECLETAACHLRKGGVVLVAPTYIQETFVPNDAEHDHNSDGETGLTYFSYVHQPADDPAKVEAILVYLIRRGGQVEVVEDRHTGGLFSSEQWMTMLEAEGFRATRDHLIPPDDDGDNGVPMFVGIRR